MAIEWLRPAGIGLAIFSAYYWGGDATSQFHIMCPFVVMIMSGTTDTDKVISAWETLTMNNTPLGTVSYNAYDHQANSPIWYGTMDYSPDFPLVVARDMVKFQDNLYPAQDEILALRAAK